MDERYAHPDIAALWGPKWTYDAWLRILTETLANQRRHKIVDPDETEQLLIALRGRIHINVEEVRQTELEVKHDVVAFLTCLRHHHALRDKNPRWLHFGLTSSDLVDTAQGMRFVEAHRILGGRLLNAASEFTRWTLDETPILGRTHGQPAEPMQMRARATHWMTWVSSAATRLVEDTKRLRVGKLSGPVGTYAHNPLPVEVETMLALGLDPMGPGASQVMPRSTLAGWANSAAELAAALAKVATDIRLMNLVGEVQEAFTDGQVGSSSMAHKRNPIRAERICGMARMARGYAAMLIDQDLWLERDISHSSVERVAVPDLWHTILFMLREMTELLSGMHLNKDIAFNNLEAAGNAPFVSALTLDAIRTGASVELARQSALEQGMAARPGSADWFMRDYPEDRSERH